MHFVENVDLVARRHRRVADGVVDLPHILDRIVRGGIHFQDVRMATFDDRLAMHTHDRHVDGRLLHGTVRKLVIEGAGKNARGRGFPDPADAGQDPGLWNAAALERVRDRAHHGVLADQVVKTCWPVFAREHAVTAGRCIGRGGTGSSGFFRLAHRVIRFAATPGVGSLRTSQGIGGRLTSDPNRAR